MCFNVFSISGKPGCMFVFIFVCVLMSYNKNNFFPRLLSWSWLVLSSWLVQILNSSFCEFTLYCEYYE